MFNIKKKISIQIFIDKCIGCGNCVNRCHHTVLAMVDRDGQDYATVEYPYKCVGCGRCLSVCPSEAIELRK